MRKNPEQPIGSGFDYGVETLRYLELHSSIPMAGTGYDQAMETVRNRFLSDEAKVQVLRSMVNMSMKSVFEELGPPEFPDREMIDSVEVEGLHLGFKLGHLMYVLGTMYGLRYTKYH